MLILKLIGALFCQVVIGVSLSKMVPFEFGGMVILAVAIPFIFIYNFIIRTHPSKTKKD